MSYFEVGQAQAAEDSQYFPETGLTVSGKFLQYWRSNGGLPVYGLPITGARMETDPETGKVFLTQWFERNRFELHPENAGTKYEVLLGLLGKDLKREALTVDPKFLRAKPLDGVGQPGSQQIYFSETGHNLSYGFLAYWQSNGGLERFGFPVSEEFQEIDPETGKVFNMQWFERARFEYHPENSAPYDILLGLLGNQILYSKSKTEPLWQIPTGKAFVGMSANSQNNLFVLDSSERISKYSTKGAYLGSFDLPGKDKGQPYFPRGLVADNQGQLYIASNANARIDKFDQNGRFIATLTTWERPTPPPGVIASIYVTSLTLDKQGNLYAVLVGEVGGNFPTYSSFVQKFDKDGKRLLSFGVAGPNPGQFSALGPVSSLAVDGQGNIFVADTGNNRVEKFDNTGKFIAQWGSKGSAPGQFEQVVSVAVDNGGNVFAGDSVTQRIQKFDNDGLLLLSFGGAGKASGQIEVFGALTVDVQNNVFVSDLAGPRLLKFAQR